MWTILYYIYILYYIMKVIRYWFNCSALNYRHLQHLLVTHLDSQKQYHIFGSALSTSIVYLPYSVAPPPSCSASLFLSQSLSLSLFLSSLPSLPYCFCWCSLSCWLGCCLTIQPVPQLPDIFNLLRLSMSFLLLFMAI